MKISHSVTAKAHTSLLTVNVWLCSNSSGASHRTSIMSPSSTARTSSPSLIYSSCRLPISNPIQRYADLKSDPDVMATVSVGGACSRDTRSIYLTNTHPIQTIERSTQARTRCEPLSRWTVSAGDHDAHTNHHKQRHTQGKAQSYTSTLRVVSRLPVEEVLS